MCADQFRNGLHHLGEAGELGVDNSGFRDHAEVSRGNNLRAGALVPGNLKTGGRRLEFARPGTGLAFASLLGREWQGEQEQHGGGAEHGIVLNRGRMKTRECTDPSPGQEGFPVKPDGETPEERVLLR